jgi:hypothetical protein
MRRSTRIALLGAVVFPCAGCVEPIPREELGEIVIGVPKVAGSEEPYPLAQLPDAPAPGSVPGRDAVEPPTF